MNYEQTEINIMNFSKHKTTAALSFAVGIIIALLIAGCASTNPQDYFLPSYELKKGMSRDTVQARIERDPNLLGDMECVVNEEGYETCEIEEPMPNGQYGYRTVAYVTFRNGKVVGFQAQERM